MCWLSSSVWAAGNLWKDARTAPTTGNVILASINISSQRNNAINVRPPFPVVSSASRTKSARNARKSMRSTRTAPVLCVPSLSRGANCAVVLRSASSVSRNTSWSTINVRPVVRLLRVVDCAPRPMHARSVRMRTCLLSTLANCVVLSSKTASTVCRKGSVGSAINSFCL